MSGRSWKQAIELALGVYIADKIIKAEEQTEESQSRIEELEDRISELETGSLEGEDWELRDLESEGN